MAKCIREGVIYKRHQFGKGIRCKACGALKHKHPR